MCECVGVWLCVLCVSVDVWMLECEYNYGCVRVWMFVLCVSVDVWM